MLGGGTGSLRAGEITLQRSRRTGYSLGARGLPQGWAASAGDSGAGGSSRSGGDSAVRRLSLAGGSAAPDRVVVEG